MGGEVSKALVQGWDLTTLGSICSISGGSGFPRKYQGKTGLPILFIKVSDMNASGNETYIHTSANTVDRGLLKIMKAKTHKEGSVIFPKVGAALLTNKRRILVRDSAVDNNIMTVFPHQVDKGFLYQWFLTLDFGEYVQSGALPSVNQATVSDITIPLPPLPEQKKIAEILSSVDKAIQSTQALIDQTQKIKKGLLQQLLTKGIGHTKFKQTEIGEIPESWEVVNLEEIALVERGKFSIRPRNNPLYYGGDIPFVQTGDISKSNGVLKSFSQTLNDKGLQVSKMFPAQIILITIAANIGDVAMTTFPVACPDSLVAISPKNNINNLWLISFLQTKKEFLESKATQNAQKNINLQTLKPLRIPLPPDHEQQKMA